MIKWTRRRHQIEPPPAAPAGKSLEEITVDLAVKAAEVRQREAQAMLRRAQAREPQVRARVRRAQAQLARNGLSDLFDDALGMGPQGGGSRA